ncbi:MAG: hypothetical protein COB08_011755 [Rhodobacteraceae bacterium]|nr:hypothetical protein [Paracoccaceae bacterium]
MADKANTAFAARVAAFCLGERAIPSAADPVAMFGKAFAYWDGLAGISDKFGQPLGVLRENDGTFTTAKPETRYLRIARALTEIAGYGFHAPLRLDMHDARDYGLPKTRLRAPVLAYNRREGAQNMVLWPLSNYHTIGERRFVHSTPIDPIPFENKADIAAWRGALSGRPNTALAPNVKYRRFGSEILKDLSKPQTDAALWALHEELMGITRYNLVLRYFMSKEMDVGLTLTDKFKTARETSLLAPLCRNRTAIDWFFKSKYVLCLTGNDTGSNFLPAANSNSIVLKEDDGWEHFYSGEFHPWEHYIPMSLGALDLEEKLAWAKENPKACKEMMRAAQAVCARFASPENRRIYLSEILANLTQTR